MFASFNLLIALGLLAWWWAASVRAREFAVQAGRRFCKEQGLQWLDQTVALRGVRPDWQAGRLRIKRWYAFEYATDGRERHQGRLILRGHRLLAIQTAEGELIYRQ